MLIPLNQPFDLKNTLMSGQAFRWQWDDPWFYGVAFRNIIKVRQTANALDFSSTPDKEQALAPLLQNYFGLEVDLEAIYASLNKDDRLRTSIQRYSGMRILRQEPWECLVSFICSSASNIPRITKNIESICDNFGTPIRMGNYIRSAFPSPEDLADLDPSSLRDIGLGYRAEYIVPTARTIAENRVDLMALREDSYDAALESLISLDGVGDKVANCVLLFSLDKPEAFPVDVWIHRVLGEWYFNNHNCKLSRQKMRIWAQNQFGQYAGYANHYLFHNRRLQDKKLA